MSTPATPSRQRRRGSSTPLIRPEDVREYLAEKAALIAPADVAALASRRGEVSRKAARHGDGRELFQRQVDVALQLLEDHVRGVAVQIPYSTVSVLTVAILYLLQPMDLIPDFIPDVGASDDALVMELAYQMARAGVERYCRWKNIPLGSVLGDQCPRKLPRRKLPRP